MKFVFVLCYIYSIFAEQNKQTLQMKKLILLLAAPAILTIVSCGGSKKDDATVSIPGMTEVNFKINGNQLSIMVPDSTKGKMEMVEQPWGATEIKVGKDFQISIEGIDGDIPLVKSDITGNEVFKLQRYLKDEPTLLFWEAKNADMLDSRFHFYTILKLGTLNYVIKDIESGDAYTEKLAQTMVDAAKTLRSKEPAKPNS